MNIRIHHATSKRAVEQNIELSLVNGPEGVAIGVKAVKGKSVVFHVEPKEVVLWAALAETLRLEYPALSVLSSETGDETLVAFEPRVFHSPSSTWLELSDEVPSLDEIMDACAELGIDPEADVEGADDEEEKEPTGGVVPGRYKVIYKERGNPSHCGDWLAGFMEGKFDLEGRFEYQVFETFLRENGVSLDGKWASLPESGQSGWQGRYRMNGRQVLEKHIALNGFVRFEGKDHQVPEGFLTDLRTKHAKWLAKNAPKPEAGATEVQQAA